jgi:hypothetical protein
MAGPFHRLNSSSSDASFKLSCETVLSKLVPPEKSFIDSILAHNNPEEAEIILPDGRKFFWYFAIGSMINPISLYLRDLMPIMSYPATCLDHNIIFRGAGGMADIEACSGAEFDGVVHLLSEEQMVSLDGMEMMYHRNKVSCVDYQGQSHAVYAYQMNDDNQPAGIPHERYLDIITKGCEYYKVRPEYINRLRNDQPVTPRTKPEDFQSFKDFPQDVFYTLDELKKHDGNDPTLPLWTCVNGKIIEHSGLPPNDHPDYETQQKTYAFFKRVAGGREIDRIMARALYEPLYKLPTNDDDICSQRRAQIEDYYYGRFNDPQNQKYWKVIGRLRQTNNSS